MKRCGQCGAKIENYHPHANYERVTLGAGNKPLEIDDKILCQTCATAVAKEIAKYQPGKLYIE